MTPLAIQSGFVKSVLEPLVLCTACSKGIKKTPREERLVSVHAVAKKCRRLFVELKRGSLSEVESKREYVDTEHSLKLTREAVLTVL